MTTLPSKCERCDHCFCLDEKHDCHYCGIKHWAYLEQKERREQMVKEGIQWWKE